jgi:DNA gyrase subunit A
MLARDGVIFHAPAGLAAEFASAATAVASYKAFQRRRPRHPRHAPARLTGLEQDKIVAEYQELLAMIVDLSDILARPERLAQVVREELIAVREQYGDARRTEINRDHLDLSTEDLIEPQDVVVTLSHAGYAKSQPVTEYQVQRRGGRGKAPPR